MARPKGRAAEVRRKEKEAAREAVARRQARRRNLMYLGVAGVVVAALTVWVMAQPEPPGERYASLGNTHISSLAEPHIPYNSRPPSSGPHLGNLINWGEVTEPVPPEIWVHNLEDGGVVLAYDCPDGCPDMLDDLRDVLATNDGKRLVLLPYEDIVDSNGVEHRAAAIAWTRVFYFDELDETTRADVQRFIDLFEGVDHHARTVGG